MSYCRSVLGDRCVLGNNSIRYPAISDGGYPEVYSKQKAMGGALYYQTATPSEIKDWKQTLQWAINQGAQSVELNSDYTTYDKATLSKYAQGLSANAL